MKMQFYYAVGKRKSAIARVKLHEGGSGTCTVNELPLKKYCSGILPEVTLAPLTLTNHRQSFDVEVQVEGGGLVSQAEAIRHGISRSLILFDPSLRGALKREGFLRRDSRIRERKKPGLKRARRAPQWAKR